MDTNCLGENKLCLRNLLLAIPHVPAKVRVPVTVKTLFNENFEFLFLYIIFSYYGVVFVYKRFMSAYIIESPLYKLMNIVIVPIGCTYQINFI